MTSNFPLPHLISADSKCEGGFNTFCRINVHRSQERNVSSVAYHDESRCWAYERKKDTKDEKKFQKN
jgi:hypothetical protein